MTIIFTSTLKSESNFCFFFLISRMVASQGQNPQETVKDITSMYTLGSWVSDSLPSSLAFNEDCATALKFSVKYHCFFFDCLNFY